jgi:hypothetical protein
MKKLFKSVSFKKGSYISLHLMHQGNLVGHVMWNKVALCPTVVIGIIETVKSKVTENDGSKNDVIDDVIYCCSNIDSNGYSSPVECLAEDLIKLDEKRKLEALENLVDNNQIDIFHLPFFGENVFKAFEYR